MPQLLVDVNIEGHGALIAARLQSSHWQEFATALEVTLFGFGDVRLDPAATDDVVWNFCQAQGYYLLTSNRHEDEVNSLGMTIRLHLCQ